MHYLILNANNLSLKTFLSLIFHHFPKAHSTLCTSHCWVEIGKVCYSSASLHTLLHLPKMLFIHFQDTCCPQVSSSNRTSLFFSFIHSLNSFIVGTIFSSLCWYTSPTPHIFIKSILSQHHPHHHPQAQVTQLNPAPSLFSILTSCLSSLVLEFILSCFNRDLTISATSFLSHISSHIFSYWIFPGSIKA